MRRFGFLLTSAAIGLSAPSAGAQQAAPAGTMPADAPQEPRYQPAVHGGLSEGAWLRMTRGTGRRSTGMMATGVVLVGLGAVLMGTGTAVYEIKPRCDQSVPFPGGPGGKFSMPCPQGGAHLSGLAILIAGSIGVALGIPLWALGASDVPWAESTGVQAPAAGRPAWAAAVPAPGGGGLAWRF